MTKEQQTWATIHCNLVLWNLKHGRKPGERPPNVAEQENGLVAIIKGKPEVR